MKNLKKVLALVVALTMVLGTVAFASFTDVEKENDAYTAVQTLSSLSILNGYEDGSFKPDGDITRAEFCAVVIRALGLESSAKGAAGTTMFTDVAADHWASGYINLAANANIVNGMGDGTFAPESNVTYEQAIKMLVVALGFEPVAAQKGGYPTGYVVVANTYGMTEGVASTSGNATRAVVAELTYNALDIPVMEQTGFGTNTEYTIQDGKNDHDYKTLLTGLDVAKLEGVVTKTQAIDGGTAGEFSFQIKDAFDDPDFKDYEVDSGKTVAGRIQTFKLGDGVNANDYFGLDSIIFAKETSNNSWTAITMMEGSDSEIINISLADIDDETTDSVIKYYPEGSTKTKKLTLDDAAKIYVNYTKSDDDLTDLIMVSGAVKNDDGTDISVIDNDGDSNYDFVILKKYSNFVVDEVVADKDKLKVKNGSRNATYTFDFDDDDVMNTLTNKDGEAVTLADFAEGDVVGIISDGDKRSDFNWIDVVNLGQNAVTGVIDENSKDSSTGLYSVYIDGTKYDTLFNAEGDLTVGNEGTFYLTQQGKVFYVDLDSSISDNFGYILDTNLSTEGFSETWQIKMLTKDAGVITYDMKSTFKLDGTSYKDVDAKVTTNAAYIALAAVKGGDFKSGNRLVTYKLDASNYVKEINFVNGSSKYSVSALSADSYKADTQAINSKILEDDAVIFNLDKTNLDDTFVTTVDGLVDDSDYTGYVVANEDTEYKAMVITVGAGAIDYAQDMCIVDSVSTITTEDGDDAKKVRYFTSNDEEIKTVTFIDGTDTDFAYAQSKFGYANVAQGSLFMFADDGNGIASDVVVFANAKSSTAKNTPAFEVNKTAIDHAISASGDDDNGFAFGYITDTSASSKGTTISYNGLKTVSGALTSTYANDNISVKSTSNAYSYYNKSSKNVSIQVGDWEYGDVDTFDADKNEVTFFFARTYNGAVKDILTFNARKSLSDLSAVKPVIYPAAMLASVEVEAPVVEAPVVEEVEVPAAPVDEDIAVEVE